MAITSPYATAAEYRAAVTKSDTGDDAAITTDLTAISRYLDAKLGQFFTKDASVQTRYFYVPNARVPLGSIPVNWAESENPWRYGNITRLLAVDSIASTSGLIVKIDRDGDGVFTDDDALAIDTDFLLWPQNAALGPEPQPWTAIYIPEWSTVGGFQASKRVMVTALWGWPAVPEAIKSATIQLTGILRLESPRATSRVNEMGDVISTSKQARDLVENLSSQYRRTAGAVI